MPEGCRAGETRQCGVQTSLPRELAGWWEFQEKVAEHQAGSEGRSECSRQDATLAPWTSVIQL